MISMSDPLIRASDDYVVLEPGQSEKYLTVKETLVWLETWLETLDNLPKDLQQKPSLAIAAKHLLDTACALEVKPGFNLQWFAIRLDPPAR